MFLSFCEKGFLYTAKFCNFGKAKNKHAKNFHLGNIFSLKLFPFFWTSFSYHTYFFFTLKTLLLVVWQGCMTITGTLTSAINCVSLSNYYTNRSKMYFYYWKTKRSTWIIMNLIIVNHSKLFKSPRKLWFFRFFRKYF